MRICVLLFILSYSFLAFSSAQDKSLSDFFQQITKIENPLDLRDPFKSSAPKLPSRKESKNKKDGNNSSYSNLKEANLDSLVISDLRVIGVLIGKERRVLVKGLDNQILTLKEGMKLGPDKVELKAIMPGGIILVEKIVNIYGQEEYLETVIPISR